MMISKNSYFNKTFFKNFMKRFWIIGLGMMVSYVLLYLYPIYQGASSEGYQYYAAYLKGSYFIGNLIISTIAILTSVALLYFYHNRTASTIIHSMPIKKIRALLDIFYCRNDFNVCTSYSYNRDTHILW